MRRSSLSPWEPPGGRTGRRPPPAGRRPQRGHQAVDGAERLCAQRDGQPARVGLDEPAAEGAAGLGARAGALRLERLGTGIDLPVSDVRQDGSQMHLAPRPRRSTMGQHAFWCVTVDAGLGWRGGQTCMVGRVVWACTQDSSCGQDDLVAFFVCVIENRKRDPLRETTKRTASQRLCSLVELGSLPTARRGRDSPPRPSTRRARPRSPCGRRAAPPRSGGARGAAAARAARR